MLTKAILMMFLVVSVVGCSQPKVTIAAKVAELNNQQSQKQVCFPESELMSAGIVAGQKISQANPDSKKVVMLISDNELCTASAITPQVLITAAHCIAGPESKSYAIPYSAMSCESGFDLRVNRIQVDKFIVHPEFKTVDADTAATKSAVQNDIALVILKDRLPSDYKPYKIASVSAFNKDQAITFYGYGDVNYNQSGAGILRKTQLPGSAVQFDIANKKIIVDQTSGTGVCSGDSGGPGLISVDGQFQILGINSYVGTKSKDSSKLCNGQAYLTLVAPYVSWMSSVLKQNNF